MGEHRQQEKSQACVSFSDGMHTYCSFSNTLTKDFLPLLAHVDQLKYMDAASLASLFISMPTKCIHIIAWTERSF